jgi:hypothetical protein
MDDLEKRVAGMDVKDDNGPTFGGNVRVQKDDGTTFTQDGPTFGGSAHIVKDDGPTFGSTEDGPTFGGGANNFDRAMNGENVSVTREDVIAYFDKLIAESHPREHPRLALAMNRILQENISSNSPAADGAAGAAAGAAAAAPVKEKKRKPKFSPAKYDATTTEEEKDDDIPEKDDDIPPPPPAPLEGLRSPTDPFTLTELEDMHKKIVQKCAPIIDGFSALNIFEVSYVEHKLKEIKNDFRKDYERNHQYVKFFKRVNKQGKTEGNADVKGGAKGRKKK